MLAHGQLSSPLPIVYQPSGRIRYRPAQWYCGSIYEKYAQLEVSMSLQRKKGSQDLVANVYLVFQLEGPDYRDDRLTRSTAA